MCCEEREIWNGQDAEQSCNRNRREPRNRQGDRGAVREGRRQSGLLGADDEGRRASAGRIARDDGRRNQDCGRRGDRDHLRRLRRERLRKTGRGNTTHLWANRRAREQRGADLLYRGQGFSAEAMDALIRGQPARPIYPESSGVAGYDPAQVRSDRKYLVGLGDWPGPRTIQGSYAVSRGGL